MKIKQGADMKKVILLGMVLFPLLVLAQVVVPAVQPAQPTYLDGVVKMIQGMNPGTVTVVVMILEAVLRIVPSVKPLSVLVPVKYLLDGLIAIMGFLSGLMGAIISSLNVVKPVESNPTDSVPKP